MNAAVLGWAERRRFVRVPLSDRLGELTLGPRGYRRPAAQVVDFSPGGVSLAPGSVEWLAEDTPLSLRVGAHDISCSLVPGSSERLRLRDGSQERVGLALDFDRRGQEEVARLYHQLRFPSLHRRGAVPRAEIRSLLADSGYMALRPGLDPPDAWLNADWPSALSHEAVFREQGGHAVGHLAITRAYKNSWLGHEIAMLPRSPGNLRCRRDLYQHFCVWPRLLDGDDTYVFGYYSPKRRFHQEMFEAFASRSSADECVVVRTERYMRAQATAPVDLDLDGLTLEPMKAGHEAEVLGMIERAWPAIARTALDIEPGRLSQNGVHPGFAALGGERARQCLVLRSKERLIAALLCEWESARLSLFDALSVAHVFLASGVETNAGLETAITSVLYDFYAAKGVNIPMFTCPPGTFQQRDVPGFKWVETMGLIVLSGRALRAFESYVELSLEPDIEPSSQGAPPLNNASPRKMNMNKKKDSRHDA